MSNRFEEIADRYLTVKLRGPVEWMTSCPFCNGESSLQFNTENGLWLCFRCSLGGTSKSLVQKLGGTYTDPSISVDVLRNALDSMRMRAKKNYEPDSEPLTEQYLARFGGKPHSYWTKDRRFTEETCRKWGLGYDPIKDRCTIAYRDVNGKLLGVIERRLDDVFPRYIYPKGFDRSGSLFGSWVVEKRGFKRVSIVEGSTDVINLDQASTHALGQYGSSITSRQTRLIRRLGVREVTLFYDYDEAGRKAEEQARRELDGVLLRSVRWDTSVYCWHARICGCGEHTWRTIGQCERKIDCRCGRKHRMDPGKLSDVEIQQMVYEAELVGRMKKKWPSTGYARSSGARRRVTGG